MADEQNGVVIESDDGVYFIPPTDLEQYRVDDVTAKGVQKAMSIADDDVAGFAWKPELQPQMRKLRSFAAPLEVGGPAKPSTYGVVDTDPEW